MARPTAARSTTCGVTLATAGNSKTTRARGRRVCAGGRTRANARTCAFDGGRPRRRCRCVGSAGPGPAGIERRAVVRPHRCLRDGAESRPDGPVALRGGRHPHGVRAALGADRRPALLRLRPGQHRRVRTAGRQHPDLDAVRARAGESAARVAVFCDSASMSSESSCGTTKTSPMSTMPSSLARASFSSLEEVAITRAPNNFANWSANTDTPPDPCTSTPCPGSKPAFAHSALHAVTAAQGRLAPSSNDRWDGK